MGEVEHVPAQGGELAHPQAVAVGDQDHGGVAVAVAAGPRSGGGDQPFDLGRGEVLAWPPGGVLEPARRDIPIYDHRHGLVPGRPGRRIAGPRFGYCPIYGHKWESRQGWSQAHQARAAIGSTSLPTRARPSDLELMRGLLAQPHLGAGASRRSWPESPGTRGHPAAGPGGNGRRSAPVPCSIEPTGRRYGRARAAARRCRPAADRGRSEGRDQPTSGRIEY